jgi:acetylornithine/LysW-gamma-L-lysine aminotransferase
VAAAIAEQAHRLITCHEAFCNDQRSALLQRLGGLVPGLDRVYLCNSGTEAVEAAIKFARLTTRRTGIVAAMRGFHGRTLGALSATWNKHYREPFEPLVPGFRHFPYNNTAALEQALDENTAAVILEVVQGEGGVHLGTPEFLQTAQDLCRKRGALLIIDEVQTGFGRTGKMLAIEHTGLSPDLLCVAKSLAGGLPMGAVLIGAAVAAQPAGTHGSTFGGNPLACAAALATLDVMSQDDLPGRAARKGLYLLEQLRAIDSPAVREVRGLGLMIGIELRHKVATALQAMLERGVIALPAGLTVLRLLPPLVITDEQLERVLIVLREVLARTVPEPDDG